MQQVSINRIRAANDVRHLVGQQVREFTSLVGKEAGRRRE
jgi:hypothetical protein